MDVDLDVVTLEIQVIPSAVIYDSKTAQRQYNDIEAVKSYKMSLLMSMSSIVTVDRSEETIVAITCKMVENIFFNFQVTTAESERKF